MLNETYQNCFDKEVRSRLISGSGSYRFSHYSFVSCLLPKNFEIKMQNYKLTIELYGRETSFIALREEHRLRVIEGRC
jgi:hypothetical protein